MKASQWLRLSLIALVVSLFSESRARSSRNQVCSSMISGRLRSWRTRRRCCGMRPLISRSMANRTSMRLTASAAIGALLSRARSKNLRRACAQHAVGLVELGEARIGVGLHQSGVAHQVLLGMFAATITRIEGHGHRRIGTGELAVIAHIGPQSADAGFALGQHRHRGVVGAGALGSAFIWRLNALGIQAEMAYRLARSLPRRRPSGSARTAERPTLIPAAALDCVMPPVRGDEEIRHLGMTGHGAALAKRHRCQAPDRKAERPLWPSGQLCSR